LRFFKIVANSEAEILLVGNKSDLDQFREVPLDEALNYSREEHISFLETSAMSGDNCIVAMQLILQDIHKASGAKSTLQTSSSTGRIPASVKLANEERKNTEETTENDTGNANIMDDKKCAC